MSRRLTIFLAVTFLVTGVCWGTLALLSRARTVVYGEPAFMLLYMMGGLGPTIAAFVSVAATVSQLPFREFHSRLFRWRIPGRWYIVAFTLPVVLALVPLGFGILVYPDFLNALSIRPWYMFVPLFFVMVAGGGLEEPGWRGVAQPEMERALPRPVAALVVGAIWSIWHLPLFAIRGVRQYGTNPAVFGIAVIGLAPILAWLYGRTHSILLCIVFHAAVNAVAALGLTVPSGWHLLAVLDSCLKLVVGALLVTLGSTLSEKHRTRRPA